MDPLRADVELARACAAGEGAAIGEVERRFGGDIARTLARLRIDQALADEIRQRVREKLFVGTGDRPPAIASYEGAGPLGAFIRAVVVHAAISARRGQRPHQEIDSGMRALATDDDPELAEVKRRYGASFKQAFEDAFATLSPRDRNILRLVYVEGSQVEDVAVAYGVHRVSVSRWLSAAREMLHTRTLALLRERLALGPAELASVTRLCLSQIDVSLERLLRSP